MPIPSWLLVWCHNILTFFTLSLSGHHSLPTTGNCFPCSRYVLYWFMWVWSESDVNYLCWSKHPSRSLVSPFKSPREVKMKIIIVMLLLLLSRFSRVQFCATPDSSPQGSPIPGILQARTLEWVAISFSNEWKWKVKVKSLSLVRLLATPWTEANQAPPSMGFSRQECWSGMPLPFPIVMLPTPKDSYLISSGRLCPTISFFF